MEPDNISSCDLQHVFGVNSAMLSKLAPRVWRCGLKKALVQIHAIGTDLHPLLRDAAAGRGGEDDTKGAGRAQGASVIIRLVDGDQ
jgi:hypothetical protein